jgi:hypothetical protein
MISNSVMVFVLGVLHDFVHHTAEVFQIHIIFSALDVLLKLILDGQLLPEEPLFDTLDQVIHSLDIFQTWLFVLFSGLFHISPQSIEVNLSHFLLLLISRFYL